MLLNILKNKFQENPRRNLILIVLALLGVSFIVGTNYLINQPITTNAKKPWSVRIQSYRTNQDASNAIQRLQELRIDSYSIKRMEKNNNIWFDVHAGALSNKKEAENLKIKLAKKGLKSTKIINFKNIENSIRGFSNATSSEKQEYKLKRSEIPKMTKKMLSNLQHFPIDENYKIISLKIADSEQAPKNINFWISFNFNDNYVPTGNTTSGLMQNTYAISQAIYEDKVFGWRAGIVILSCKQAENTFRNLLKKGYQQYGTLKKKKLVFNTDQGQLTGNLYFKKSTKSTRLTFIGKFADTSHVLTLVSSNLSEETFLALLNSNNIKKGLLVFPEVRHNLSLLPKNDKKSIFTHFELKRLTWEYAKSKNYEWWAKNMVGYWNATGHFLQNNRPISIDFFNLIYTSTANKIEANFQSERKKDNKNPLVNTIRKNLGGFNTPTKVHEEVKGWYIKGKGENDKNINELSFPKGSLLIAVDSSDSTVNLHDLKKVANHLQIW